jgi:integrase/recombinase XerD
MSSVVLPVEESPVHSLPAPLSTQNVTVYTRHKPSCPRNHEPYWKRCHCMKYLYLYKNGESRQVSAKTRSWEKAEERAQEIRDSWNPIRQLERQLRAKVRKNEAKQISVADAVCTFLKEVDRLNREESTRAKYRLTLVDRLLGWCATQKPPIVSLGELDVETVRRWIHSWHGAPTTRHNQHQRVITFFFFCVEQGWMTENPAKKIKKVSPEQDETLPFTREQFEALIEATYFYDSRDSRNAGDTVNSRRARAYLKLLRWSGLRAGDAACLSRDKLRDDDSLFLYQKKVKGKASSPVYGLLPHDVAEELRNVPASAYAHPNYFLWSGRSKRKSEVSNWIKIFGKILATATEKHPKLFKESDGQPKPAQLHMLRDTFAVEYLLAGMPLDEVSRLLGHSSVLITQKHYAPWVLERQQRLATSVRTAWSTMGVSDGSLGVNIAKRRPVAVVRSPTGS